MRTAEDTTPGADRVDIKSMTREDLCAWLTASYGEPAYRGEQLFAWLHRRRARDLEAMTNVSKELRARLLVDAEIGGLELLDVMQSSDGTRKLLLQTQDGHRIESVLIPMEDKITQCVSSQVGCRIGCDFCLTARMVERRNLSSSEIVDQVLWAAEVLGDGGEVGNIVYMGMGEPLDNYDAVVGSLRILMDDHGQNFSSRRITVSTSGVASRIARLGADVPVNLAVSLNATTDAQRDRLIPINRKWDIDALLAALHSFPLPRRRRITVEYVMLAGVNDHAEDARRLVSLLHGLRCKVNLIPFNPWPGAPYARPEDADVNAFGKILRDASLHVTVRYSKGEDIGAACGQLDGEPQRDASG
jgi:23S rRNA (adenine2503-C2)-methyltransferase